MKRQLHQEQDAPSASLDPLHEPFLFLELVQDCQNAIVSEGLDRPSRFALALTCHELSARYLDPHYFAPEFMQDCVRLHHNELAKWAYEHGCSIEEVSLMRACAGACNVDMLDYFAHRSDEMYRVYLRDAPTLNKSSFLFNAARKGRYDDVFRATELYESAPCHLQNETTSDHPFYIPILYGGCAGACERVFYWAMEQYYWRDLTPSSNIYAASYQRRQARVYANKMVEYALSSKNKAFCELIVHELCKYGSYELNELYAFSLRCLASEAEDIVQYVQTGGPGTSTIGLCCAMKLTGSLPLVALTWHLEHSRALPRRDIERLFLASIQSGNIEYVHAVLSRQPLAILLSETILRHLISIQTGFTLLARYLIERDHPDKTSIILRIFSGRLHLVRDADLVAQLLDDGCSVRREMLISYVHSVPLLAGLCERGALVFLNDAIGALLRGFFDSAAYLLDRMPIYVKREIDKMLFMSILAMKPVRLLTILKWLLIRRGFVLNLGGDLASCLHLLRQKNQFRRSPKCVREEIVLILRGSDAQV